MEAFTNILFVENENPGFEDGTISSAQSANAATVEAAAARTGNYGAKVTGSGSVSNLNYPYKSRNPEEGKYFRAGVWVKAADEASVGKEAYMLLRDSSTAVNGAAVKLTTDWQYIYSEKYQAAEANTRFGPIIPSGATVYVDDFVLEAFTPAACTVTTDMTDGATEQETEVDINYTFSNTLSAALTVDNFTVTPEGATVAVDGNKLTLSGLAEGTTYTVALNNVTDKYSASVAHSISFTTKTTPVSYDGEVLWGFEGSYDNSNYSDVIHSGTTGTISTDVKYSGNQSLKVVTDGAAYTEDNDYKPDVIARNKCENIEIGVPYIVSYYAKAEEGTTNRVGLNVSSTMTSTNTVLVDKAEYNTFEINDSEWTKITCYLVAKEGSGTQDLGVHMLIFARQEGTFYIDQLEIRKATVLDLDSSIIAVKSINAVSGDAELSLYSAGDKTVYFLAALYEGSALEDAKLSKVTLADDASQTVKLSGVDADDKIFIWDNTLKPLSNVLSLSDFD